MGGRISLRVDLGSAALDPVCADDGGHDALVAANPASADARADRLGPQAVSTLSIGLLYGASTLFVMFAGMPIALALGAVATVFMISFMPASSVDTISQNVYEEMASITLLSIRLLACHLLRHRLSRNSRDAKARLFARLCRRHHRGRRHPRHPAAAFHHHDPLCGRRGAVARPLVPRRDRAGIAAGRPVRGLRRVSL